MRSCGGGCLGGEEQKQDEGVAQRGRRREVGGNVRMSAAFLGAERQHEPS